MPEGPEVRTMADYVRSVILGWTLDLIVITRTSKYKRFPLVGRDIIQLPAKIHSVISLGKKIIIKLDNGYYLISSLIMTGAWSTERGKHCKLYFILSDSEGIGRRFYFNDTDGKGHLHIYDRASYKKQIGQLGPSLLDVNVSKEDWIQLFRQANNKCRSKQLNVCDSIMDQKIISGIGNYLKAEILYYCKINPHANICDLSDEDLLNIRKYSYKLVRFYYKKGGLTIRDYKNPFGTKCTGTKVYAKKITEDGCKIITEKIGTRAAKGRTHHWCPDVQKIGRKAHK